MWINAEDARSDFILAAAAAVFMPLLEGFVMRQPGFRGGFLPYPGGILGTLVALAWLFAGTGLVPLLLAGYRNHGATAFGFDQPTSALGKGVVLALPIPVAAIAAALIAGDTVTMALRGLLNTFTGQGLVVDLVALAVTSLGVILLVTFLTVRARDAFKPTVVTQLEALRTFGMGAVGVAMVLGLLLAVSPTRRLLPLVFLVLGVAAVLLLVDREVEPEDTTTRATVLAPAITVLLLWVFRGGGLFTSSLVVGLYAGTVAAAVAIAVATMVDTRRLAWAVPPLVLAASVYGTPLV